METTVTNQYQDFLASLRVIVAALKLESGLSAWAYRGKFYCKINSTLYNVQLTPSAGTVRRVTFKVVGAPKIVYAVDVNLQNSTVVAGLLYSNSTVT